MATFGFSYRQREDGSCVGLLGSDCFCYIDGRFGEDRAVEAARRDFLSWQHLSHADGFIIVRARDFKIALDKRDEILQSGKGARYKL